MTDEVGGVSDPLLISEEGRAGGTQGLSARLSCFAEEDAVAGVRGVPWLDHRQQRAMVMFRVIWPELAPYMRSADQRSRAADHLFKVLSEGGFEVLSDAMRAEAGLPARDGAGWTVAELAAAEARRVETLRGGGAPPVVIDVAACGEV